MLLFLWFFWVGVFIFIFLFFLVIFVGGIVFFGCFLLLVVVLVFIWLVDLIKVDWLDGIFILVNVFNNNFVDDDEFEFDEGVNWMLEY